MFVPPSLPLLPVYQPTYSHLLYTFHEPSPCLGHKDEKGAVPALSSYCQKDRTTTHTNCNTVYGWNGVCQMDKERREAFQMRVSTLYKGREEPPPSQSTSIS